LRILAADTALGACSVAVLDDEKILAHRLVEMQRGHAEALAPMAEAAMRESGIAFADLDRLAVTTGPGTFTGQRVGLAFMRGLRIALKVPLIGIATLEAMAAQACMVSGKPNAAVLHDARRGEVYALLAKDGAVVFGPLIAPFEDAVAQIQNAVADFASLALAGTAAEAACARLPGAFMTSVIYPDALWVARLAHVAPEPMDVPRPLYLRAADAKLPA
jgi:tRNA threonylcarbamoyladenosine biosynthesis protein TsaB